MIWDTKFHLFLKHITSLIILRVSVFPLPGLPFLTCLRKILQSKVVVIARWLPKGKIKRPVLHRIQTIWTLCECLRPSPLEAETSDPSENVLTKHISFLKSPPQFSLKHWPFLLSAPNAQFYYHIVPTPRLMGISH